MLQHLIVFIIFAVCMYFVIRGVVRIMARAKKNEPKCDTCTETSCPLRETCRTAK